jgi:hypothetical protein
VGLAYYRVTPTVLESVQSLIKAHEAELVGPRARGYWFDRPEDYDYLGVQGTARRLDETGRANAIETLELSEVQAHGLALLDVELPNDGSELPPALFMSSGSADTLRRYLKIARRQLADTPEKATARFVQNERDPRFSDYLNKQLRHLREALPMVWHFHERVIDANDAIIVVDLRARDLEIPEEVELVSLY